MGKNQTSDYELEESQLMIKFNHGMITFPSVAWTAVLNYQGTMPRHGIMPHKGKA